MIKFNDDNIYVGYIKQLLTTFNLPQCQIGKKEFVQSLHYIDGTNLYFYDATNDTTKKVDNYKYNDKIVNITKNLEIRNNYYDSYTHEYLGDFLRYVRDYKDLNLMPLYNCFSNVVANLDIHSVESTPVFDLDSKDESYTIFCFPVKYKQKYTIAIDWHGKVEVCCGFYQNGKAFQSKLYNSTDNAEFERKTYQTFSGLRFSSPILYDKLSNLPQYDYANEKCLKMYIKIPIECKSSIVVLEGDYRDCSNLLIDGNKQVLANKQLLHFDDIEYNEVIDSYTESPTFHYRWKSQLLTSNSGEVYLLADRLVEYLSNQAVTPLDPVTDNIRRLQRKAKKEYGAQFDYYGIWDDKQRKFIYEYIMNNDIQSQYDDLLAYLDKDVSRTFDIEYIQDGDTKEDNDVWVIR